MRQKSFRFDGETLESRILLAADLSVTYDPIPETVRATEEITYVVRVRNNGPDDVANARVEFSKPGLTHTTWTKQGPNAFPARVDLSKLNGDSGFAFDHRAVRSVAGDLNGDGFDDLVVASLPGIVSVIFGDAEMGNDPFSIHDLDGTKGFVIEGVDEFYEVEGAIPNNGGVFRYNGLDVLGDINADGIDDMRVDRFVLFGSRTIGSSGRIDVNELDGANGFHVETHSFYPTISPAGDFNGDGIDDLLVAEPTGDRRPFVGEVWVHYGHLNIGNSGRLPMGRQNGSQRLLIQPSTDQGIQFGRQINSAGDVNNDGFDDILVTDRGNFDELPEAFYLILGGESGQAKLPVSLNSSQAGRVTRFVTDDRALIQNRIGPLDWNGDGFDDLFVDEALIFGGPEGILELGQFEELPVVTIDDLIDRNGLRITYPTRFIMDLNGDGRRDRVFNRSTHQLGVEFSVVDVEDLANFRGFRADGHNGITINVDGRTPAYSQPSGDINDDGIQDLVIVDSEQTYLLFGSRSFRSISGPMDSVRIPAGGEVQIEITGYAPSDLRTLANSVQVTLPDGEDPNPENNSATSSVTTVLPAELSPSVDLSVWLRQSAEQIAAGDEVSYTLRVSNDGPTYAKAARLKVDFDNLSMRKWTRDDGTSGNGPIDASVDLFPGQTHTYTILAKVGREFFSKFDASITAGQGQENSNVESAAVRRTTPVPRRTQFPTVIGNVSVCHSDTYAIGKDLYFVGWPSTGDAVCFLTRAMASSGFYGGDLWKTDGTAVGTQLVKHIRPQQVGEPNLFDAFRSTPNGDGTRKLQFAEYNGLLFFAADDGEHGSELWRSDGTEAGTYLVKDVNPTVRAGTFRDINQSSNISLLQVVDDVLAFRANDGTGEATWISDGTAEGTEKAETLSLLPVESQQSKYTVAHEKGQFVRFDGNDENPVVLAEREVFPRNLHTWSDKAIFNNVENPQYAGYDPLLVLDLDVDEVDAIAPAPFQPDHATDFMKSFATEVIAFKTSYPALDYRDEAQDNNPFEFLNNNPGSIRFNDDGANASITVGFPAPVVDGPGHDIKVKLKSFDGTSSVPVFGITSDGTEIFLAQLKGPTLSSIYTSTIDLSTISATGPFTALRFEASPNSQRLFSVEATIQASAIFTAAAPNNLDYEFRWDLNGDGVYGDRIGRSIGLTKAELADHGIAAEGEHPVSVMMNDRVNDYFDETTFVVLETPTLDALAGDVNKDGAVSFADFLILSANFGQTDASREQGDLDGDGFVAFYDFIILQKTFGSS